MSYLVLARKWRPAVFEEIIGQEHVTRTLRNAIRMDRVAHAFLFTGARGVGKTTAARVLAKALQCEQGPTETPCGECASCSEITSGNTCVDVFEIDGASNRGINEIRELRDSVAYAPQRSRYKIYIIDEVHMLTQEAFNALLKTLEEPPSHVKFIFATTEPQKIPVTILSRCQRYDFKRVSIVEIREHLEALLTKEEVSIAPDGLRMIARESEGSVRDALSLLDRVISFVGAEADAKAVADCLGIADREWLMTLTRALVFGDASTALSVIADAHHYGYDLRAFTADLLATVRDVIVVHVCGGDSRATELSDVEIEAMRAVGEGASLAALQRIMQLLLAASDEVARSNHPRVVLEMTAIRACMAKDMQTIPELMDRLQQVTAELGEEPPAPMVAASQPTIVAPPPEPVFVPEPVVRPTTEPPIKPAEPAPVAIEMQVPAVAPIADTTPPDVDKDPVLADAAVEIQEQPSNTELPAPEPKESTVANAMTREEWGVFVDRVKGSDPLLASMLESVVLVDGSAPTLRFGAEKQFYVDQLTNTGHQARLTQLLTEHFGQEVSYVVDITGESTETIAAEITAAKTDEEERRHQLILGHPLTQSVVEATQGSVIDVRVEEVRGE